MAKTHLKKLVREDFLIEQDMVLNAVEEDNVKEICDYLNVIAEVLKKEVKISKRSGIRTVEYEKRKGRTGTSQHSTYNIKGRGAVDLIYFEELLNRLKQDTFFTRICYYPNNGFIHCDRKPMPKKGYLYLYEAPSPTGKWKLIKDVKG